MNEFKMTYQLRTNLAKYENGDVLADSHSISDIFFFPTATTCPSETAWSQTPPPPAAVTEVKPTSEVGTPSRRGYVVPMRMIVK